MKNRKFNELRQIGVFKVNAQSGVASARTNKRRTERLPTIRLIWMSIGFTRNIQDTKTVIDPNSKGTYVRANDGALQFDKHAPRS